MKKRLSRRMRKMLLMVAAMALVLGLAIGGTVAWLIDSTTSVVNTFTESDVDIELSETLPENKTAKMVPGATIAKDPKVTVLANSEDCYVFVKIDESTDKKFSDYLEYTVDSGWTPLTGVTGVYYRTVSTSTSNQEFNVLANNQVSVKSSVTKTMMDQLTTDNYPKLTFTAYAIQLANAEGEFAVVDAWKEIGA